MHKNTSITLGAHYEKFIAQQVAEGRFGTTSEAIRAALRLLEEREMRLSALRRALVEGEESGSTTYSLEKLMSALDKESQV